jgi:AcrR family transcriptional regulator
MATGVGRARSAGRRRSADSHLAILAATRELLSEVGYSRLTVEGVAARAGVGKTTVYRWWSSKKALALEAVGAARSEPPPLTGDLRHDLRAAMDAMLSELRAPFADTLLALAGDLLRDASEGADPVALFDSGRDVLATAVEDAAQRGDLPADVDDQLVQDIYTGTLLFRVLCRRSTDDVTAKLVELLVDGEMPRRTPEDQDR